MIGNRRAFITIGVMGGTFLAAIEATIVATAMPTVVAQLGGLAHYSWVFAAYLLTSTVTMTFWGKLSDLYGRRPFYLAAVSLFVAGSALCGTAQSMTQLILFRAVQGLGAGGLVTLGMTIIGELYTPVERGRIQGSFSGVWGVASIIGPIVGGYITEHWSWRWVFYLNLPFGVIAAGIVGRLLVDPPRTGSGPIDGRGAALMTASLTLLLLALSQTGVSNGPFGPLALAGLYATAVALGVWFAVEERRAVDPVVPPQMVTDRLMGIATGASFMLGVAIFGAISFVPLFVQGALGGSATQAARSLTPLLMGWVVMSVVAGRLIPRFGYRSLTITGMSILSVGYLALATFDHRASMTWLFTALALIGLGTGMVALTLLIAMQNAVPRDRLGVATALSPFARSVGAAIGVAMMGAILSASVPAADSATPLDMERGLHYAFVAGGLVAFGGLVLSLFLPATGLPSHALHGRDEAAA